MLYSTRIGRGGNPGWVTRLFQGALKKAVGFGCDQMFFQFYNKIVTFRYFMSRFHTWKSIMKKTFYHTNLANTPFSLTSAGPTLF